MHTDRRILLHMNTQTFSVTAAAEIAEIPRGTLAAWRSRGDAPVKSWGEHELLNLGVLADLLRGGLTLEAATALAWRITPGDWQRVEEMAPSRCMMQATRDDNGTWGLNFSKPGHASAYPPRCTVVTDLTTIAVTIKKRVAEYALKGLQDAGKVEDDGARAA